MLQLSANGPCEEFYIFLSKVLADNRGTGCKLVKKTTVGVYVVAHQWLVRVI